MPRWPVPRRASEKRSGKRIGPNQLGRFHLDEDDRLCICPNPNLRVFLVGPLSDMPHLMTIVAVRCPSDAVGGCMTWRTDPFLGSVSV